MQSNFQSYTQFNLLIKMSTTCISHFISQTNTIIFSFNIIIIFIHFIHSLHFFFFFWNEWYKLFVRCVFNSRAHSFICIIPYDLLLLMLCVYSFHSPVITFLFSILRCAKKKMINDSWIVRIICNSHGTLSSSFVSSWVLYLIRAFRELKLKSKTANQTMKITVRVSDSINFALSSHILWGEMRWDDVEEENSVVISLHLSSSFHLHSYSEIIYHHI
jgi:hypothetical protein